MHPPYLQQGVRGGSCGAIVTPSWDRRAGVYTTPRFTRTVGDPGSEDGRCVGCTYQLFTEIQSLGHVHLPRPLGGQVGKAVLSLK